ncbi:hypothetical protein [Nocardia barduliensis]|uniref:hypothetical protein n=1 Tax=Nocardia barduliensis TaxID=2736643 RepID=UPI0015737496|nr:hypothetical protein [Nocardia barduliensis]
MRTGPQPPPGSRPAAQSPSLPHSGAPRSRTVRPVLVTRFADLPDPVIHGRVREVLDFFETCPECGYPAQAIAVERERAGGRIDVVVQPGCGLPCGWQGRPRIVTARPPGPLT